MKTWVALLRGINVGGKNIIPMKALRSLLEGLGYKNVKTYIQSGNCIIETNTDDADALSKTIANAIKEEFGFSPSLLLITPNDLRLAIEKNPYPQGADHPQSVHLFFLSEPATQADIDALNHLRNPSEAYQLTANVFYVYAPEGIARSKLAMQAEKKLGVATTARNLRSAIKILELAE